MALFNKKINIFWVILINATIFFTLCCLRYIDLKKILSISPHAPHKIQTPQSEKDEFDFKIVQQDNVHLINTIRRLIDPPSKLAYNLSEPNRQDFSLGQSFLVDRIFKQKKNGFFIECGAMDGEGRSNTLFLERDRGWNGLLVEANILNYHQLKARNRKSHAIHACASIRPYPERVKFNLDTNMGRVFKSKKDFDWAKKNHRKVQLAWTQCFPLYSMLLAMNRTTVDYFSLDVEGNELDVLKTIPFDKVDIKVMSVEILHGPGKKALKKFLASKGYKEIVYLPGEKVVDWDIMVQKIDMK